MSFLLDRPYDLIVLGGGQLARMTIQAAQKMGLKCLSLELSDDAPAFQITDGIKVKNYAEAARIAFEKGSFVTLENEFVPAADLEVALVATGFERSRMTPDPAALALIQDKLLQREAYSRAGVPSPMAVALTSAEEAASSIGFPMVLKARFGGYDGKGTRYARTMDELLSFKSLWEGGGWLAESFVDFERELAQMVAFDGKDFACFPTMETIQTDHVCDLVFPSVADASKVAISAVNAFASPGLYGVEMFALKDGTFSVNEIAPRPHNSGHYTLDWGGPSQFDVHVRVACGLPLPALNGELAVCMANLLGQEGASDFKSGLEAISEPAARFHWYGKKESRVGRKMGHINLVSTSTEGLEEKASIVRSQFYAGWCKK